MIPAGGDRVSHRSSGEERFLTSSKLGGSQPALSQVMLAAMPAVLTYWASCSVGSEASFSRALVPR